MSDKASCNMALIIAVSRYKHGLPHLDFCKNDGEEIARMLRKLGYVVIVQSKGAKLIGRVRYDRMREAIIHFFKSGNKNPKCKLLFYYSGHGIPYKDRMYLASSEIDPENAEEKGYPFTDLTTKMNDSQCNVVTILDCCFSGEAKIEDEIRKARKIMESTELGNPDHDTYLLGACLGSEQAHPSLGEKYSQYTSYLLDGLRGDLGSYDKLGIVTPITLDEYVRNRFRRSTRNIKQTQTPVLKLVKRTIDSVKIAKISRSLVEEKESEELLELLRESNVEGFHERLKKYPKGKPLVFKSQDLEHIDIPGARLSDSDLSRANLSNTNLSEAILSPHTILSNADLSNANLDGADLAGAYLDGADLSNATLSNADLSGANLVGADLSNATLSNADLSGAIILHANLSNADLSRANLRCANLSYSDLSRAILSDTILHSVKLFRANLSTSNLSFALLACAELCDASISDVDLSHADLSGADLYRVNLCDADLSNSTMIGARLCYANLSFANLCDADLSNANLSFANLCDADLSNAVLLDTNLSNSNLSNVNLTKIHVSSKPKNLPRNVRKFSQKPESPTLAMTMPNDGIEGFPPAAPIGVIFNHPVKKDRIKITLSKLGLNSIKVLVRKEWLGDKFITITPVKPLEPGSRYSATIATFAKDPLESPQGAEIKWSFTTDVTKASFKKLDVKDVYASDHDGNLPQNTLGTNPEWKKSNDRWSCYGIASWIQFDLKQKMMVCAAYIGWHKGDRRKYNFEIYINNGRKPVYYGESSGAVLDLEKYYFAPCKARSLKILVNGNSQNNWASIKKVEIHGLVKEK